MLPQTLSFTIRAICGRCLEPFSLGIVFVAEEFDLYQFVSGI